MRFIQVYALDHLIAVLDLLERAAASRARTPARSNAPSSDGWTRRSCRWSGWRPGYERNRDAALAILDALEGLVPVDARMARAIRAVAR